MTRNKMAKRAKPATQRMSGRAGYFLHRAWSNIRQNPVLNLLTTGTIFLSILLFSFFLLVYTNVE
ncbi:MAG TPA: ABC transporter permease, partial [Verrucomicrobiae bacterium]|nr:ABC transporter permease [Verrucomicrobiae bacterium]